MPSTHAFAEQVVIDKLRSIGPCSLDDLVASLSELTWGEVFATVDRMSRDGEVWLSSSRFSLLCDPPAAATLHAESPCSVGREFPFCPVPKHCVKTLWARRD